MRLIDYDKLMKELKEKEPQIYANDTWQEGEIYSYLIAENIVEHQPVFELKKEKLSELPKDPMEKLGFTKEEGENTITYKDKKGFETCTYYKSYDYIMFFHSITKEELQALNEVLKDVKSK